MFVVVNKSTRVSDSDVKVMARAVAHQLHFDAAPVWGKTPVPVVFVSNESDAAPGSYVIAVLDDSDQADALGWHTEDQGEVIYGRVFAGPVLDNGGDALHNELSVASVLSHEILETFIDAHCNLWAQFDGNGDSVAYEVGDPVESDSYGVPVRGHGVVTVSNFVLPRWFDPEAQGGTFDHMGRVKAPFTLTTGGYVVELAGGEINPIFGDEYPEWRKATKQSDLSRTYKRLHGPGPPPGSVSEPDVPQGNEQRADEK